MDNAHALNSIPSSAFAQSVVQTSSPAAGTYHDVVINATTRVYDVNPTGDVIITGFSVNGGGVANNTGFGFYLVKNGFTGRVILANNTGSSAGNVVVNSNVTDLVLEHAVDGVYIQYLAGRAQWFSILPKASKLRINSTGGWNTREKLNAIAGTGISLSIGDNASERETNLTVGVNTGANYTWTGTHAFGQVLKNTGIYTQTSFVVDVNDLAVGAVSVVRMGDPAVTTASADYGITGIVPVSGDGQLLWLESMFSGDRSFILFNDHESSLNTNRFSLYGGEVRIYPRTGVWLRYNGTLQRWIVLTLPRPSVGNGLVLDPDINQYRVFAGSHFDFSSGALRIATAAAGAGLIGGGASVLAVGAGTGITVNADDVAINLAASLAWTGAHTFAGWPVGYAASSSLITRTPTIATTSPTDVLELTIPANTAGAGACFRFHAQIQCSRTTTTTACSFTLDVTIGGTQRLTSGAIALATATNSAGAMYLDGELTMMGAVSASAPIGVVGTYLHTLVSATPVPILPTPSVALTAATNASLQIKMIMTMSANVANVGFTPLSAYIQRVR